jgi:CHAT domain-containing protein/Tfp pilus assembly protein PilF
MDRKKRIKKNAAAAQKELLRVTDAAEELYNNGNYEPALQLYIKALEIQLAFFWENHTDTVFIYSCIGTIYSRLGNLEEAIICQNHALNIQLNVSGEENPDIAVIYNNISNLYHSSGYFDDSLSYSNKALDIQLKVLEEDHPDFAITYNGIGVNYLSTGDYEKALEFLYKALKIKIKIFGEYHPEIVNVFRNIGSVYSVLQNYDKSLEYYCKALEIQLKNSGEKHPDTARTYNLIGGIFYLSGNLEKAIEYTSKALAIQIKILGDENPDTANTYCNMGTNYASLENYDKSLEYLFKALEIQIKISGDDYPDIIRTYMNLGSVYSAKEKYQVSIEYYLKALNLQLKFFGEALPNTANIYRSIGTSYYSLGKNEKAIEYHQRALDIQLQIFGESHPDVAKTCNSISCCHHSEGHYKAAAYFIGSAVKIIKTFSPYLSLQFIENLLDTYKVSEKERFLYDTRDSHTIIEYVNDAIEIIENIILESSPRVLQKDKTIINVYHGIIEYFSRECDINKAFEITERVKAREFLLRLSIINAATVTGADPDLILDLISLLENITMLAEKRDSIIDFTDKNYLSLTEKIDNDKNLISNLEKEFLKNKVYKELRNPEVISIDDASLLCKNGKAIIEYVVSNEPAFVLCILVKESDRKIIKMDENSDFDSLVTELRKAIIPDENYNIPADSNNRERGINVLYEKLIEPFENELEDITELIIIPDGILGLLPFDILRKSREYPFLCEKYTISLMPSVSILNYVLKRKQNNVEEKFLGFGGAQYSRGNNISQNIIQHSNDIAAISGSDEYFKDLDLIWDEIPGSLNEVLEIGKQVFDNNETKIFTGIDASERNVKQLSVSGELAGYSHIHFACHGYLDSVIPQNSAIVLSEVSGLVDSCEDGYLTMKEIVQLNFNSELIVLSACDTGIGKVAPGEGIIDLSRAFHIAGCNRVVVTLWEIADEPTSNFMVTMYKKIIKDGLSYKDAFVKTKIEFIRSTDFNEPVFWAAFVLYGV